MRKSIIFLFSLLTPGYVFAQTDSLKIVGTNSIVQGSSGDMNDSASTKTGKIIKGIASFYSKSLDGTRTATGETFFQVRLTGASNNFPLNTWVRVTNLRNHKSVIVRINDRMSKGMAKKGRVVDLSRAAAEALDFIRRGIIKVKVEQVFKGATP